ncbi:biotin-dependent carboxyltransferase family protein [Tamlana sp. 2201CG12-4]|uniref:5-oxoprolinase subunit C family protein n=1 Tax=Tamlana sp. 2201CG12-4 TaxID=3112582 RepID=UPI002DB68AB5|nr:biotin-dependent carboxyltransferase family protein [Tamlana sp. 2201CG12-4]MEC3907809.1 biotin-dependent carboxyltransferase family protein [Tamlana sp. 2201CG12-4]
MIKVLHSGFYSTIQDLGRNGYQEYGVPYSGAMDQYAASMANALLGNTLDSAVIEVTMTGATLQFQNETCICLTGADMNPKVNDINVLNYKVISIKTGDVLSFGRLKSGFRTYIAVLGGFNTETVMNSRSMYKGITSQHKLNKGDELSIAINDIVFDNKHAVLKVNKAYLSKFEITVFKGPEFNFLTQTQQHKLLTSSFTISNNNNRMAYQLEEVIENTLDAIITAPVLPGTVQLTPSGKLIVLMRDCQTTGGYPRVLQLKESALDVLAQKHTGKSINFTLNSKI